MEELKKKTIKSRYVEIHVNESNSKRFKSCKIEEINIVKNNKLNKTSKYEEYIKTCRENDEMDTGVTNNDNIEDKEYNDDDLEELKLISKPSTSNLKKLTKSKILSADKTIDSCNMYAMSLQVTQNNSKSFYNQLCKEFTYLNLNKLSYEWFIFIFKNSLQNEIYYSLNILNNNLKAETRHICPRLEDIWKWTEDLKPKNVSVVILGQDPYHTICRNRNNEKINMADGMAFSVSQLYSRENKRLPGSLLNIGKQAAPNSVALGKFDGNLKYWLKQGVLLLNTTLTTVEKQAGAHENIGWKYVTEKVLNNLNKISHRHLIFLLWGQKACSKSILINIKNHIVIKSKHPSPLSVLSDKRKLPSLPSITETYNAHQNFTIAANSDRHGSNISLKNNSVKELFLPGNCSKLSENLFSKILPSTSNGAGGGSINSNSITMFSLSNNLNKKENGTTKKVEDSATYATATASSVGHFNNNNVGCSSITIIGNIGCNTNGDNNNIKKLMCHTTEKDGWFKNNHFEITNLYLQTLKRPTINWSL